MAKRRIATTPIPIYARMNFRGTLPMNIIIMLIPNIISAVDRFSGIMRPQTIPTGKIKYFETSMKLFRSFWYLARDLARYKTRATLAISDV